MKYYAFEDSINCTWRVFNNLLLNLKTAVSYNRDVGAPSAGHVNKQQPPLHGWFVNSNYTNWSKNREDLNMNATKKEKQN